MQFLSDNTSTACPQILAALAAVNQGHPHSYGDDEWTRRLEERLADFFGTPLRAFPVATGTAANALAIATLSPPWGAIYCHEEAHIATDECGAPGLFTGGAQLALLAGEHGRIAPLTLTAALNARRVDVHTLQPSVLSLTQLTELGTSYRPSQLTELCAVAHAHSLSVHMDGARFANALAFLGCHPSEITWRAGVDVLSFGATKNGALGAEAVVFFNRELVRDFELHRKRAGHLFSKSRYLAAQLLAYLDNGLCLQNAGHSNRLAQRIAEAAAGSLLHPVEGNEVFVALGVARRRALREAGFDFYDWGAEHDGQARLVVSWDQSEADVGALCAALTRG